MNKIFSVFFSFFFISSLLFAAEESIYPGKIILKFKANSPSYEQWLSAGKSGELQEISSLIGQHISHGFISQATLRAVEKFFSYSPAKKNSSSFDNISRICVVEFTAPLDVKILAKKISSFPDIEYAEPMPRHKIFVTPNDPLLFRQHYLSQVSAYDAWDIAPQNGKVPLLAIVDTGTDYTHKDLAANIFVNPGEDGNDNTGRSKRTNGIDDDNNGAVDDWHGWDFSSSTSSSGEDNDPYPGHEHGTHVSGIAAGIHNNAVGIAGMAPRIKILPVKVGPDDAGSTDVNRGYDGILYAAAMGADVINCSWGSPARSEAEREIIETVVEKMRVVMVAAAGNENLNTAFYPAGFPNVISVAAVDWSDNKAAFTNFHATVDISAPGVEIFSTVPDDTFDILSGTSMASPMVAGIAAVVQTKFPSYSPLQIAEQIKATSVNLDERQPGLSGLMGRGRINFAEALRRINAKSSVIDNFRVFDANKDSILDPGEKVELNITLKNFLSPLSNVSVELQPASPAIEIVFQKNSSFVGNISSGDTASTISPIIFTVPDSISFNHQQTFSVIISDSEGQLSHESIVLTFRPSYRNFRENNIFVTFNSNGNIGFNDYPSNTQGIGFRFNNSDNLLYEGALMIASSSKNISNVARNSSQRDTAFSNMIMPIRYIRPGTNAALEGETIFGDTRAENQASVDVNQHIYQFTEDEKKNFVIVSYDVMNKSGETKDFYTGLFFDWDIGTPSLNQALFDIESGIAYAYNIADATLPYAGAVLLSSESINFYAIDNDGRQDPIGVYNNFSNNEKWATLSCGLARRVSNVTDISFVLSGGPAKIDLNTTHLFVFALVGGFTLEDLRQSAKKARETAKALGIADGEYIPPPTETIISNVYPNPADYGIVVINYTLAERDEIILDIMNVLGETVMSIGSGEKGAGLHSATFNPESLPIGQYFVRLASPRIILDTKPFVIIR